ncbi:MAG: CvpA family protein [Clostridia bacterium]|nr:CvpA family protein [Clostridia bacterium]
MGVINWIAFGGILVDLVIISIIASNAFFGYRRGLIGVIFKILTFLISILIMFVLYKPVSNTIIEKTKLDEWLSTKIYQSIEGTSLADGDFSEYQENKKDNISKVVMEELDSFVKDALSKSVNNVAQYVSTNVAIQMIRIGTMLLLFMVSRFFLLFIRFFAEIIANLPIIRMFNRSGGLIYGIIKGFLVTYVILGIFSLASPLILNWGIIDAIQDSTLGNKMYNDNVLIKIISNKI